MIDWQWCALHELPARRLYALFAARQKVFVVEQACAYLDLDGLDDDAEHLIAWSGEDIAAYLRLLAPGTAFAEPSLGRVLTMSAFRGSGLGRELMLKGLARAYERYPGHLVRIGAQAYLQKFYSSLGFTIASEPYLEDGIPHLEMLHNPRL
jgi:ElaA protein